MSLFQNVAITAIFIQNFFFGAVFYTYLYFLPIYYQNVRQYSTLKSAFLIIPLVLTQSVASFLSGQYISRTKRYGEVITLGFVLLCLGVSLTTLFDENISVPQIIGILIVLGYGNGNVFQPTIIALQAHARKSQRAVVISIRNFLRALGGAILLAVSAAVLQNVLKASLPPEFKYLAGSTYVKPNYASFDPQDAAAIKAAYAKASRAVFILLSPLSGICLITCAFVKDIGLVRSEEKEAMERQKRDEEAKRNEETKDENQMSRYDTEQDLEKCIAPSTTHEIQDSEMDKQSDNEVEKVDDHEVAELPLSPDKCVTRI